MGFVESIEIMLIKKKVSKAELARRLGESPQNMAYKFKRNTFKDEDLKQIAAALGCNITYSFTDRESGEIIYKETL